MSDFWFWKLNRRVLIHWMQRKKNPSSLQSTISEKTRKTGKNGNFLPFDHFWPFWPVFLDFFIKGLCRELRFFALHSVHQNPSFELSKSTFFLIFHPKGGPFRFRGGKILPSPEIIGLERNKKRFWNRTTMENKLGTCRMLGVDFDEN